MQLHQRRHFHSLDWQSSDRGKSPRVHCCRKTNPTGGGWLQHLAGTHNFTLVTSFMCYPKSGPAAGTLLFLQVVLKSKETY